MKNNTSPFSMQPQTNELNLTQFKEKLEYYLRKKGKRQNQLVEHPDPRFPTLKNKDNPHLLYVTTTTLSHKLTGTKGSTLTPQDAETIVKALASWNAFDYREDALELLRLGGSQADLSTSEWKLPYIERLKARPSSTNPPIETSATAVKASSKRLLYASVAHQNWGDAPLNTTLYGREDELNKLSQLLVGGGKKNEPSCQLVAIIGMGGIGKTTLCAQLAHQISGEFDYVFWQSLRNAPTPESFLLDCLQFLANAQNVEFSLPATLDKQLSCLMRFLQDSHCLLILDNLESVLQEKSVDGRYQKGYEAYGQFLRQIAEVPHRSCLVVTSREKPKGFSQIESGRAQRVFCLKLDGLAQMAGGQILRDRKLSGTDEALQALVKAYSGNPLALLLIAESVRDLFNGNVKRFLEEKTLFFGDIEDVLDEHFNRLSNLERVIILWLAVAREPLSLQRLTSYIQAAAVTVQLNSKADILEALKALQRRALVEFVTSSPSELAKDQEDSFFTLQNVIMEYATHQLIKTVSAEIKSGQFQILNSHALLLTDIEDYVRNSQLRMIIKPLLAELNSFYRRQNLIEARLIELLGKLRLNLGLEQGYAGGNLLNLLCQLFSADNTNKKIIRGLDLSGLNLWHVFLVGQRLLEVNLTDCDLSGAVFNETFDGVLTLAFSPNDYYLAMGSVNGRVQIWRIADNKLIFNVHAHTKAVRSVCFDSTSKLLATASDDGEIKLWDLTSVNALKIYRGHLNRVWAVAFSPDNKWLVSGGEDCTVKLWDVTTGHCVNTLQGHTNWVRTVAFSPDGNTIASGSGDNTVRVWDAASGKCLHLLTGHSDKVRSVAFSSDGNWLASGSEDFTIKVWDCHNGQLARTLHGHSGRIRSIAFSLNPTVGLQLVSGGDDQTVRIWDGQSGECLQVFYQQEGWIWSVAVSANGGLVATGSEDQFIRLLEIPSGRVLRTWQGYSPWLGAVAVSPDGNWLASGGEDAMVELWDLSKDAEYPAKNLVGHTNRLRTVAFSPDGQLLASGGEDHTLRLWKMPSGECVHVFREHGGRVRSVVFSPDGHLLASGGEDQTIKIWDIQTKKCLHTLTLQTDWVGALAFSPDGRLLASNGEGQSVRLWGVSSGEALSSWEGHSDRVRAVAFSPDGSLLATGSVDRTAKIWELATGKCLATLTGHTDRIRSVAFSPDGKWLATASEDTTIGLWEVHSGKSQRFLESHTDKVWSVVFGADGSNLYSASEDGTVKIWNVAIGKCVRTLQSERPYERTDITGVVGLTDSQKITLKALGAIDRFE